MTTQEGPAFQRGGGGSRTVPRYAQIAQMYRQYILSGKLLLNERLGSSEAAMAAEHGVALSVIRAALRLLRDEGWVVTEHGIGTVVARGGDREVVPLRPGERADARMPDPGERRRLGMAEGVPVTVVCHADGTETLYDSTRYQLAVAPPTPPSR